MTGNARTVLKLREQGFDVHVAQLRIAIDNEYVCTAYPSETRAADLAVPKYVLKNRGQNPSGRGGKTVVTIRKGDDEVARGEALCNIKDNFCKSTGLAIALGRALKTLQS